MKKTSVVSLALVAACVALTAGCAPMISGAMNASLDNEGIAQKTAKYFGVPREGITMASVDKGPLSTSYQVKLTGKLYNCTIYYGEVNCKQPGV